MDIEHNDVISSHVNLEMQNKTDSKDVLRS